MTPDALTIPGLLAHRRDVVGDDQAIVADDDAGTCSAMTYRELDEASADVAARLVAAGVVKGDRVALVAPNGVGWIVTAYGAMRIGAVLVPLSTLLRPPELLAQLATACVTHLIAVESFRGRHYLDELEAAAPGLRDALAGGGRHPAIPSLRGVWHADHLPERHARPDLVDAMVARVVPADDLVVMFTSGSSGAPKGVVHTHGGAVRACAAGLDARCIRRGERVYIPMPFFWTGGFAGGLVSTLVAGATLLTEAIPEPSRTLGLLERERVTLFRGWPDQAVRLAADPSFGTVDLSTLGDGSLGALLPPERRPTPGARANLFGMTETFGPYCGDRLDVDLPEAARGSCGRPFAGIEVRIVDTETGAALHGGGPGEINVRGPNLMRAIFGKHRSTTFTADGFYGTGDLGRLDQDRYLWYDGRLDEMFKIKGATVYPSEVEAALRSIDGVRQAYVVGTADETGGAAVAAALLTDASIDAIAPAARARLSSFKVPTRWLLTADAATIPMTASDKVDKARLRELLGADRRVVLT